MKERKGLIPVLMVVALLVWGWNLRLLFLPRAAQTVRSEELPEIPADILEEVFSEALPDLTRDPFVPDGRVVKPEPAPAAAPVVTPPKPKTAPPVGRLVLILREGDALQASVELPGGDMQVVTVGQTLGAWRVDGMDLETVTWVDAQGETYVMRIFQ